MKYTPDDWFLGIVEFDVKDQFTRIQPVAKASLDRTTWENIKDVRSSFPTRGLICWFEAPPRLRKNYVVEFQVVAIPRSDPPKPENFQAHNCNPAYQIIDLVGWNEQRLREALTGDGLSLPNSPNSLCLLRAGGDRLFGAFDLVKGKSEKWHLAHNENLESIPVFDGSLTPTNSLTLDGKIYSFLFTGGSPPNPPWLVNWQSDIDVLKSVLMRLQKIDKASFKELKDSNVTFTTCLEAIQTAELFPAQIPIERARSERLMQLRNDLRLTPRLIESIVEELEKFDVVQQRLNQRLATLMEERRSEIEANLLSSTNELASLNSAISVSRMESETLAQEIDVRKSQLQTGLLACEEAAQARLREILESPARAIMDAVISSDIYSVLGVAQTSASSAIKLRSLVEPSCVAVADIKELLRIVSTEFYNAGIAADSVFPLVTTFVAGLQPICIGEAAPYALRLIARTLFGGNAWRLPVSPLTTSLHDLLSPSQATRSGNLGSLGDILEKARGEPDHLSMILLEHIDNAPTEFFLTPLIELAQDVNSPSWGRIPVLMSNPLEEVWPRHVILAFTIAEGSTALPLPQQIWTHAPLIEFRWSPSVDQLPSPHCPVRLPVASWFKLRSAAEQITTKPDVPKDIPPPGKQLALRMFKAAIALGASNADANAMVLTHIIAPLSTLSETNLQMNAPEPALRHSELARSIASALAAKK